MHQPDGQTDLQAWCLDRYWDAVVTGDAAEPEPALDSGLKEAARRLQGDAVAIQPNASFVARLEAEMMSGHTSPVKAGTGPVSMTTSGGSRPMREERRSLPRKGWPALDIAAVVLLAVGIVSFLAIGNGGFSLPWHDGNSDQPMRYIPGGPSTSSLPIAASTPATPPPAKCTVEPRTIEEVIALVGIANPAVWDEPYARSFPMEQEEKPRRTGELASPEIVAEIQATLDHFAVCSRQAGTLLESMAFWSDDLIKRDLNRPLTSDAVIILQATIAPVSDNPRPTDIVVEQAEFLDDGRIIVDAVASFPPEAGIVPQPATFIFVGDRGRWLIDRFFEPEDPEVVRATTPDSGFTHEPSSRTLPWPSVDNEPS